MASEHSIRQGSLYPEVIQSNPEKPTDHHRPQSSSSSRKLYPSLEDMNDLVQNLFPESTDPNQDQYSPSAPPQPQQTAIEETLIQVPGAIVHLIDTSYSVELACGELKIIRLVQEELTVAVLASVGGEIQWPLTKEGAAVKLDGSHYFFSLQLPPLSETERYNTNGNNDSLNYGVTIASKGQEDLLKELDGVLENYCYYSVQEVSEEAKEALDGGIAKEIMPMEMVGKKKEMMEKSCAAYWTTLAPNVEDYSGTAAKLIASGSGKLIQGILWCGDVTVERLKWGNEALKQRMVPGKEAAEVSPETLKRIKRVKSVTQTTQRVATGLLSGVVKVSGFFMSSVINTKAGKKLSNLVPGEVLLASLDGFNKVCDAVEVAGKNVMSTSSDVTTDFVNHKYGEKAAEAANEGLGAAGHALGTAWAAFKLRKALNPKSVIKPTNIAKSAVKAAVAERKVKESYN